jgi:ABC-type sugar transport system substrate-binding protein
MKTRFKIAGLVLLCAVLASGTLSCSKKANQNSASAADGSNAAPAAKKIRVGFTVQDLTNPYFTTLIKGINDRKERYGIELFVHDAKTDAAAQVNGIENFITQELDIIVIHPVDPVAPEAVIKQAQKAGIPVISWSELVKGSDAFFTMNQYQYGHYAGEIAGKWAKTKFANQADAQVLFVMVPEVAALAERGRGLKEGFLELVPGATVVGEQAGNTPEAGMKAVETVLVKNPGLNIIVACNDAVALGAYNSMQAAGKKAGDVAIVGLDATAEALQKIKDKTMYIGTVDIGPYEQGELFCSSMVDILQNGPPKEPIYVDFVPVDQNNINNYF